MTPIGNWTRSTQFSHDKTACRLVRAVKCFKFAEFRVSNVYYMSHVNTGITGISAQRVLHFHGSNPCFCLRIHLYDTCRCVGRGVGVVFVPLLAGKSKGQHIVYAYLRCSRYSDSLQGGRSGDRIPVRYSAPIQTGPWTQPASYTMCNGSFQRGKAAGAWRWPPTPSSAEVKERVELYLYTPLGLRDLF